MQWKSTIAERITSKFELAYYKVDDHYQEHVTRCDLKQHPTMCKVANMGWNEIWMRPPKFLVSEEIDFYREQFGMILHDLLKIELGKSLIIEGAGLLPELIWKRKLDPKKVLYMIPTKEFQIHHYSQREFIHDILKDCEDPEKAFENWMMRDHLFGQEMLRQAKTYGYGTILVDGERNLEDQFEYVSQYFGLLEVR